MQIKVSAFSHIVPPHIIPTGVKIENIKIAISRGSLTPDSGSNSPSLKVNFTKYQLGGNALGKLDIALVDHQSGTILVIGDDDIE